MTSPCLLITVINVLSISSLISSMHCMFYCLLITGKPHHLYYTYLFIHTLFFPPQKSMYTSSLYLYGWKTEIDKHQYAKLTCIQFHYVVPQLYTISLTLKPICTVSVYN